MQYTLQHIADALGFEAVINLDDAPVNFLLTDSRRISFPASSLFFALQTERRDAHIFIKELYERGVKNFVVRKDFDISPYTDANFLFAENTLQALQRLAAYHRSQFNYPVIAITGSNGKTVVKEWLHQLLSPDYNIVRSPRSYNSQTGVALSLWQMNEANNLAIFEAGISQTGEMEKIERMIQPNIGLFTNIGEAHNDGFKNLEEKIKEKLQLFKNVNVIICNTDDCLILNELQNFKGKIYSWSMQNKASLTITSVKKSEASTTISTLYKEQPLEVVIDFTDDGSIQNAISCICVMLYFSVPVSTITNRMKELHSVDMRMQLLPGINNCSVINDSYSFDLNSFSVALDFLMQQHQHEQKTVILSDIPAASDKKFYTQAADMLQAKNIQRVITIGERWNIYQDELNNKIPVTGHYLSTDAFIKKFSDNHFRGEAILLKGARVFMFEKIAVLLERKVHQTVMEINLNALAHNLKQFQQLLKPGVKLMAMVKAFGYGSGAGVANLLQFHKADYLAVAYADEGVELRKANISLPILVLNIDEAAFETLVQYHLEPELFSINIFKSLDDFLSRQGLHQYPVHIKLDTGMHRLGFEEDDLEQLISLLENNNRMTVRSVFTHLAASENADEDAFTQTQAKKLLAWSNRLQQSLNYIFLRHIANSAAIFRNADLQFDMVRPGIGLYGVHSDAQNKLNLQTVATLKTTIAQIRNVEAGDTVGYNRSEKLSRNSLIATLRIGYADGFRRQLSNGVGKVFIKGKIAPVIGTVAMDMTMIDITDIPGVKENDEVEIFGKHIPVSQVAKACGTIAYEILTGINQRVKRVYVEE